MPSLTRSFYSDSDLNMNRTFRTSLERVEILETRLLQSYEKAESSKLQALLDEKRIRGLEAQNLRLTGFMSKNKQNLPTELPPEIREQLEAYPEAKHAASTHQAIDREYSAVAQKLAHHDPGMMEILACEMASKNMVIYVCEVDRLSHMPGGLKLAFELVLYLGKKSYFVHEGRQLPTGRGDYIFSPSKRKADGPLDDLLFEILTKPRAEDENFLPVDAFWEVDKTRRLFSLNDKEGFHDGTKNTTLFVHKAADDRPFSENDTFFQKSYSLMCSYLEGPVSVVKYYTETKNGILEAYEAIEDEVTQWKRKDGFECSSYRLSTKMKEHVQAVRRLGYMAGGERRAFELAFELGQATFTNLSSMFGGYNYRPSDPLVDDLLVEMAKLVMKEDPDFDPTDMKAAMDQDITYLEDCGICTYLPRSHKLLSSYMPGAKEKEKTAKIEFMASSPDARVVKTCYDQSKQLVMTKSRNMAIKLEKLINWPISPSCDWVSEGILQLKPEVEELGKKPQGLIPAIQLILLLGKYSYTALPLGGPTLGRGLIPYTNQRSQPQQEIHPRRSDSELDNLLLKLLEQAKSNNQLADLDLNKEVASLEAQIEYLAEFDIKGYFEQSHKLMLSWM